MVTPSARLARIRSMLFSALDGTATLEIIDWMPSHKSRTDVGKVQLLSGRQLSLVDLLANDLADSLAKEQALSVRVHACIRAELREQDSLVTRAANHGQLRGR